MKTIFKYVAMAAFLLPFASCDDDDKSGETIKFEIEAEGMYEVAAELTEQYPITFTVKSPMNSSVKSNRDWCKVETEKEEGVLRVKVSVDDNHTGENRMAKIGVHSPSILNNHIIEVHQKSYAFNVKGLTADFAPEGGEHTLRVATTEPWVLTTDADWITFDEESGNASEEEIEVKATIQPNETGIVRMGTITLKSTSEKEKVKTYHVSQCEPWETEVRVGDPGVTFDMSRVDPVYQDKITEWMKAGVTGGIPALETIMNDGREIKEFEGGTSVDDIIAYTNEGNKYRKRVIYLKNGEYVFNKSVRIYSGCTLVGESRDGVIIKIRDNGNLSLYNANAGGVRNLTLRGDWMAEDPDPTLMKETLAGKGGHKMIDMTGNAQGGYIRNSYVDNVKIINSASHPIWMSGYNNTVRDVEMDGAYNKDGGAQGYFFIDGDHQLITGCKVTHLRHVTMQNPASKQNVFYKNDIRQEFSFHVNDGGDNLIEHNRITVPTTLSTSYTAIMGPWSSQHQVGGKNFIYRNRCVEENRGNNTPWSDNELYIGPWENGYNDEQKYNNFRIVEDYPNPTGSTLYPVVLKK
ncbi:BACON domain-containing protein [Bacteroides congonensis]|jgi:hypothetical protein|uniref:BACON domain-containing protein n=1 Tax=Bacteroides congonensis TaxID=1871006 RepID=UPI0009337225|nr:BACON domain-containing carbohydrate-binding protein [Bacteroides congonensis]